MYYSRNDLVEPDSHPARDVLDMANPPGCLRRAGKVWRLLRLSAACRPNRQEGMVTTGTAETVVWTVRDTTA